MQYQPTRESVARHPVPDWFHDAKLGIFVHWGLYSVPAWAPLRAELSEVTESGNWADWFANNPYAEWYGNTMRFPGGATHQYHAGTYGADFPYQGFVPMFNDAAERWDPGEWVDLFKQAGARYAVLTTKHHDGFLLWPSRRPNPFIAGYHARRDLVGEFMDAVRNRGLSAALYYSGGLDWTFNDHLIQDIADLQRCVPQMPEYVEYANGHWRELIERYQTRILWNDIAYPAAADLNELFAEYYNRMPDGLVNNRFTQKFELRDGNIVSDNHCDFETPEYATFNEIQAKKWESCRGIGASFGYNRQEGPAHHLTVPDLVRSFVDIVSKNGNLLINIGPKADGSVPEIQRARLLGLGAWLDANGQAIFETRPWSVPEGKTDSGVDLRFTQQDATLYATVMDTPQETQVELTGLRAAAGTEITLLRSNTAVDWQQTENGIALTFSEPLPESPAHALAISPQPTLLDA